MSELQKRLQTKFTSTLNTKRLVGTDCEVFFDFEWKTVIGHGQPRFRGLQDLSMTINRRAQYLNLKPVIVLTTDPVWPFFQELKEPDTYVAVVRFDAFQETTKGHDRSALFFLNQLSASASPPLLSTALHTLEAATFENMKNTVESILAEGGSGLLQALLKAAEIGLEKQFASSDIATLSRAFANDSDGLLVRVAEASRKQLAIVKLEELLEDNAVEGKLQLWFQNNTWVMGTSCVRILDERRIDVKNITDYIVESLDGFADIVEIKRPGLSFWNDRKDHDNYIPHQELVKAITQAQNYQLELEREMDSLKTSQRLEGVPIAKPSSLLIHGRSSNWNKEHFTAQRILNAGLSNVTVLTYDQVLKRARSLTGPSSLEYAK